MRKFLYGVLVLSSLALAPSAVAQSPSPTSDIRTRVTDQAKERTCESRQSAIKNRMASLVRMATNMMEKFDSISTRTQNFYTEKVLPKGKSVPNYESLVADVAAKKALAEEALSKAQTDAGSFSCDAGSPRELYNQFKTDMQAVKRALAAYRTSIKNLISAVKRAGKSLESSPSPTP